MQLPATTGPPKEIVGITNGETTCFTEGIEILRTQDQSGRLYTLCQLPSVTCTNDHRCDSGLCKHPAVPPERPAS